MQALISDFFTKKNFSFIQPACTPASAQKEMPLKPAAFCANLLSRFSFFYSMLSFPD